jgi:predicted RNase H-like HicB family nuclease
MRYHVILLADGAGRFSVSVPAMPGCFSAAESREGALANAREAMELWLDGEAEEGRRPLADSPEVVAAAVQDTLEIVRELREDGSYAADEDIRIELVEVGLPLPAPV